MGSSTEAFNTPKCIALYPNVLELDDNGKYTCILAFKKGSEGAKFMQQKFNDSLEEFFNGEISTNFSNPVRDGNTKKFTDKETGVETVRAGFADTIFITAKTKNKPFVVDYTGKAQADENLLVHGRYVIANLKPYSWDYGGKEGFSFGLQSIQVTPDIDHIPGGKGGGGVDPLTVFGAVGEASGAPAPEDDPANYSQGSADSVFG
jgi:hypothetical protein